MVGICGEKKVGHTFCFNTQVRIERLKAIRDTPRQSGSTDFHPEGYNLKFSHVSYDYQSDQKKTVLKDVSFDREYWKIGI